VAGEELLDCTSFALDVTGTVAVAAGPLGYLVSAGAFSGSVAIDIYQEDAIGGSLSTTDHGLTPFEFADATALKSISRKVNRVALLYSFPDCLGLR
jgi:hypothetical protein